MIVGYDAYFVGDTSSAWGATERNLLRELAALATEDSFRVFVTPKGRAALPELVNVQPIEVRESMLRNAVGRARSLGQSIRSLHPKMDVYVETCEILPRLDPNVTVLSLEHDFSQGRLESPLSLSRLRGMLYRHWHLKSVRRADTLFCNSDFTLRQLRQFLRPGQTAVVFPHGCDDAFRESGLSVRSANGLPSFLVPDRYFLFVGRVRVRHKRFGVLLSAFEAVQSRVPGLRLVVVSSQDFSSAHRRTMRRFKDRVLLLRGLQPEEIAHLYRHAAALVLPSEYEGFGIPIIEAQGLGCPVIASNIEVFREVAGGGCVFFDGSVDDLTQKLELALDRRNVESYVAQGRMNCQRFSWRASAQVILTRLNQVRAGVQRC